MTKFYTDETLLHFYYGECEILDTIEIESNLESDIILNHQYASIYHDILDLNQLNLTPSENSIKNILQYSKLTA